MPGADTLLNTHQGSQFLGFFFLLFPSPPLRRFGWQELPRAIRYLSGNKKPRSLTN